MNVNDTPRNMKIIIKQSGHTVGYYLLNLLLKHKLCKECRQILWVQSKRILISLFSFPFFMILLYLFFGFGSECVTKGANSLEGTNIWGLLFIYRWVGRIMGGFDMLSIRVKRVHRMGIGYILFNLTRLIYAIILNLLHI